MSSRAFGRSAAAIILAVAASAKFGEAQQKTTAVRVTGSAAALSVSPADSGVSSAVGAITLPAVLASGAPRSYQVVSIAIPDALSRASSVEIEIIPRGEFVILGPKTRSVGENQRSKFRLAITIGIPTGALAGRLVAAEVRFSSPGSPTVVVPVEIDVSLVKAIALRAGPAPVRAQAGSDVFVSFDVVNSGNSRETVNADLTLPEGWAARELLRQPIVIGPGEAVKRRVRLQVPPLSNTGSSFVRVELRQGEDSLGSEAIRLEVVNSGSIGRQAGPRIVSAYSHAADENGRPNSILTLSANGALYDSVRIDARLSQGSALSGATSSAFAHLGSYQTAASIILSSPSAQLSLGNTGTTFSDLTGLYPYGSGALLRLENPVWSLNALGAVSIAPPGMGKREPMLGIRGERAFGDLKLSTSITHLAEAAGSPRRLDAIGLGAAIPSVFGSTLKAEIAERRFETGSGLGWSSELVRTGPFRSEQLRIAHAPGGSDAFARATNELVLNLSERLTSRTSVSGSAWRTTDASAVFSGLSSGGYSVRPQYQLLSSTSLGLEMRSYFFDATSRQIAGSAGSGFGNRESEVGVSLSTSLRQYYLNSSAFLGNVTRTVSVVGRAPLSDRTPRNYWTSNAGWSGPSGAVELQSRIEQTRDRAGFVYQQSMIGIRGDEVVLPWLGGIRGEGDLQRVNGFGKEKSAFVRAGVAVPIMNGFAIKVAAERNSMFHSLNGKVPWIIGVRFEHARTVRMIRPPGTSGYVYEDRNGNQRRDPDEPGVAGAVVRRGSEMAIADHDGEYRVGGDSRQPPVIDEASLPDGWSPTGAAHGDLAVSLSTSAVVELVVAVRSGIAVMVDLSKAHVIARDSAGREWAAKMSGPTTATFEALPVGTYTLEFDLSELSEPLVPRAPMPPLVVSEKDSQSITVTLDPRPIRMWTPPRSQGPSINAPEPGQKPSTGSGPTPS
jgi:hypothetical protein